MQGRTHCYLSNRVFQGQEHGGWWTVRTTRKEEKKRKRRNSVKMHWLKKTVCTRTRQRREKHSFAALNSHFRQCARAVPSGHCRLPAAALLLFDPVCNHSEHTITDIHTKKLMLGRTTGGLAGSSSPTPLTNTGERERDVPHWPLSLCLGNILLADGQLSSNIQAPTDAAARRTWMHTLRCVCGCPKLILRLPKESQPPRSCNTPQLPKLQALVWAQESRVKGGKW